MWLTKGSWRVRKGERVLMFSVSVRPVRRFISWREADRENICKERKLMDHHCVFSLITEGLCDSSFDSEPILPMWPARTSRAKTQFLGDCRVSAPWQDVFIYMALDFSLSLGAVFRGTGTRRARQRKRGSVSNCYWLDFRGWDSLSDAGQNKY